ncbi:MAG: hypothetical protein ACE5NM_08075 [Sedimentisphaerales bacterium]
MKNMGEIFKINLCKLAVMWIIIGLTLNTPNLCKAEQTAAKWPAHIQTVLDATELLKYSRGERLPLYLWQAMDPGPVDDEAAEKLVKELDERGVGLVSSWDPNKRQKSLAQSLTIAKAQKKLGLRVNINATKCLYSFFNGDERTAHIDEQGRPFWDDSFGKRKMGCPFALDFRRPYIREQLEYFVGAFKQADLDVDFIFVDWEIDGPIEFNEAHAAAKRCQRCRENIENIDDFEEFQKVLRKLRCELQREVYAEPIKKNFPKALVGNYGVYPHGGYRYWYDYYEYYVEGQPTLIDQRAKYRKWYHEFGETGYTFAMPVVYTWDRIFDWYDYADTDYRWFYNMLLVASNAGQHTPPDVPIISFVHWHTIKSDSSARRSALRRETRGLASQVQQFSEDKFQELLWHMLLRGTNTFFLWCRKHEAAKEIQLVHQVYAEAQQYGEFLSNGKPINFSIPKQPGTVISGLRLKNRVLIRRTDFKQSDDPVEIGIADQRIKIWPAPRRCQIISLN